MKNTTPFFFSFALMLACQMLPAQEIEILWDNIYHFPTTEKLNDLVLLPGWRLAGVGEMHRKGKPKAGLFVLIDSRTGQMLEHEVFPGSDNQVLKSVTEADDGTFYLVGSTMVSSKQQGWLLRLDANLGQLQNMPFGEQGSDDRFEKIAWMDNGKGLILGFSGRLPKGDLWVLGVDGNEHPKQKDIKVGNGLVGTLVGMQKAANHLWLVGNLEKGEGKGGAWLIKLNQEGFEEMTETFGGKHFESVHGMFVAHDKVVSLAGEISLDQYTDAWVMEYDPKFGQDADAQDTAKIFDFEWNDHASAILKTQRQQRWLALKQGDGGTSVLTWDKTDMEEKPRKLTDTNFKVARFLRTARQDTFYVAGTVKERGRDAIRVICFRAETGQPIAPDREQKKGDGSKGGFIETKLKFENFRLDDANGDGLVSPGELAAVHFDILNMGGSDVEGGEIVVAPEPRPVQGLSVLKKHQDLFYLSAGESEHYSVSLKGEANLKQGTSNLRFIVRVEGREFPGSYPVGSIEVGKAAPGKSTQISILSPTPSGDERKVPATTDRTVQATFRSRTTRKIDQSDPKPFVNDTEQEEQKANTEVKYLYMEDGLYVHEITMSIALDTGINKVQIKLDDYLMEPVLFELSKTRPNLHILAIGPTYTDKDTSDIKYPAKDAKDFAEALAQQEGLGFFENVFVDTLLSPSNTHKQNIEDAFNALLNRHLEPSDSSIGRNDYLMVFYSGHGEKIHGRFHLIPSNYKQGYISTCVDYEYLLNTYLGRIQCKKLVFIDACLSGAAPGDTKSMVDKTLAQALLEANNKSPGTIYFSSCSGDELSYEDEAWENGAFTEALLEVINGEVLDLKPRPGDKAAAVSVRQLQTHLEKRVPAMVKEAKKSGSQMPNLKLNEVFEDLTIFAVPER